MASGAPDTGDLISIPALLARNARAYGARPAYREKEFGIWQCWSWAEAEAEIRAMARVFWCWGSNAATLWRSSGATGRRFTGRW
ncbi:MAG: hypothetical protein JKP98_06205 [Rhodobacteraceae bacterium]|nr:hypothetical protein [Paracoccaceae bacterium]